MKRTTVKLMVGVVFGGAAFGYFLYGIDWLAIKAEFLRIKLHWVVLASLILFGEFVIRAWRWQILLRPLQVQTRFVDLFVAPQGVRR